MEISFNFCLPSRSSPIPEDERIGAWRCRLPWRVRKRVRSVTTLQENVSNGERNPRTSGTSNKKYQTSNRRKKKKKKSRMDKSPNSHRIYMRKIRGELFHSSNNRMILSCIYIGTWKVTLSGGGTPVVEDHGTNRGTRERNIGRGIERTAAENARRKIRRSSRNEKEGRRILAGTCPASIHHGLTTGVAQAATTPSLRV